MHSVAFTSNSACCHQIRAQWVVLWQIGSKVHFLPLKLFAQFFLPREAELPQMPAFDEVNLAIAWQGVHFIGVLRYSTYNMARVCSHIGPVVPQEEGVLLSGQPALLSRELQQSCLAQFD